MTTDASNYRRPCHKAGTRRKGPRLRGDDSGWNRRACPISYFQETLRVLIIHLVLLLRRQADLVDQIDALLLEDEQRRRIGAEDEMVGTDGVEGAARARRVVAGRFQVHHLQIVQ